MFFGWYRNVFKKNSQTIFLNIITVERFRRITDIVKYAFAFSDIEVLKAYIDCFDPVMWLSWSTRTADSIRSSTDERGCKSSEKNLMFIGV